MSEALIKIAAEVVSAYVSKNSLRAEDLVGLLADVHGELSKLEQGKTEPQRGGKPEPFIPIKKTITPLYLISLEDGKHYKTLRRHLATRGLTPDQYRAKWGLPADYPMICKEYSDRRSAMATNLGLGRKPATTNGSEPAKAIIEQPIKAAEKDGSASNALRMAAPHPRSEDGVKAKEVPELVQAEPEAIEETV